MPRRPPRPRPASRPASSRSARRAAGVAALVALLAAPLAAGPFEVRVAGGGRFATRYPPLADPTGSGRLLLLTDAGNWIALPAELVLEIVATVEERGFGRVIDARTIELGPALNDAPAPAGAAEESPEAAFARRLDRLLASAARHTVGQFVEPEEAEGIPLGYAFEAIPPPGSPLRFVGFQDRP